ncbi:MAG: hypothetical protein PHI31_13390 [Desulfuromonadaceae bacterium]|nr:hypothetical protein [Desulfuromonadaceae bacterium]
MKIRVCAVVGIIAVSVTACSFDSQDKSSSSSGSKIERREKDNFKMVPFHGEMKTTDLPLGIEALKKNHLEVSATKTIGEAFDSYKYAEEKKWLETPSENGPHYIDYVCWFHISPVSSAALQEGVVKRGVEIKFVVRGDGETYIAMVSRIDITSDGMRHTTVIDPSQIKKIVTAIYENKEISF